jgi:hypothetical protein
MYDRIWMIKRIFKYIKNIKTTLHHLTQNMARDDTHFFWQHIPKEAKNIWNKNVEV